MSRLPSTGSCLLLLLCLGSNAWCYDIPLANGHRPLETLFRANPSTQKHASSGSVPGLGHNGSGAHDSHGSLANDQLPSMGQQRQSGPFQPVVPLPAMVQHHHGVFHRPGAGNHRRWHADQGLDVPAFQPVLPAIDIGSLGGEDDFIGHEGPPGLDTGEYPAPEPTFENEIGDNPLFAINRPPSAEEDRMGAGGGRMLESIDLIREQLERIKQEEDIEIKSNLLMKLLTELPEGPLPIVYIEDAAGLGTDRATPRAVDAANRGDGDDAPGDVEGDDGDDDDDGQDVGRIVTEQFTPNGVKRSGRYYRRYPWKRQNARSRTYDAEARYLCVPSREDVFKLLVGLHENRIGNHQKTVNFCNRKRPAKAIFTNIRFLG